MTPNPGDRQHRSSAPVTIGDVPGKGQTRRTIRVDDNLWLPAAEIAKERGENLSEVVRQALTEYIQTHGEEDRRNQGQPD